MLTGESEIGAFLEGLRLGEPQEVEGLAWVPLLSPGAETAPAPRYRVLDELAAAGLVEVTELGTDPGRVESRGVGLDEGAPDEVRSDGWEEAGPRVDTLQVRNRAGLPLLIVAGEELVGGKQNRTVNLSILCPPGSTVRVPVSCVEQGRWTPGPGSAFGSERMLFSSARACMALQLTEELRESGSPASDQLRLWEDVEGMARSMGATSPTGDMGAIYRKASGKLERYVRELALHPAHVGGVFFVRGRPAGIDAFDTPRAFRATAARIVQSYALDVLRARFRDEGGGPEEEAGAGGRVTAADAEAFIERLLEVPVRRYPTPGLGENLRLADERATGPRVSGGALVWEGQVVHLGAFMTDGEESARRTRVMSFI